MNMNSIYVADFLGALLIIVIVILNRWWLKDKRRDVSYIKMLMVCAFSCCIIDPYTFWFDGKVGFWPTFVIIVGNTWIYAMNVVVGSVWIAFLCTHLTGVIPKRQKVFIGVLAFIGFSILISNSFNGWVFYLDSTNTYHRGPLFFAFVLLGFIYMVDGLFLNYFYKKKSKNLLTFPIWSYIIPVICGVLIQSIFYGTSTIWPFNAIAIGGICISVQSKMVFMDKLTGLRNRLFLDGLAKEKGASGISEFILIMLDLNSFKQINDMYGHLEGDEALVETSDILRKAVGTKGICARYAGDEFIILLNAQDMEYAKRCIDRIEEGLEEYNLEAKKQYQLSACYGYARYDMKTQDLYDVINEADIMMYESKKEHYKIHDRRRRDDE